MPRFYFHVRDGRDFSDHEGMFLSDTQAALREAITFAGRIISEEPHNLVASDDWHLDLCGEDGALLFRLDFRVSASSQPRQTVDA